MSLMKYAVAVVLLAIVVSNAEETKLNRNNSPLTSSNDNKQQNKRLAIYGSSSDTLNSGFRPITTSYSSVNNYVGNPQPSAASNIYSKAPATSYNPYYSSQNDKYSSYKSPSYSSYQPTYQQYQPLAYTPTQPAQFSYAQPSNNYAAYSSVVYGPQSIAQQIPYAYSPIQPINPVLHAAPIASFANSYQTPTNAFYVNPQQIHKVPFYNQQPQAFNVASYPSTNYHVKQFSQSSPHSQIITSKPVALDSPIAQSPSLSHIEHNNGAVSYTHFSHLGERKPSAAPLIASQSPQQVYYHQQPQPIYNADYSKQAQYAAVPIASNYYPAQVGVHYGNVPYAHISKVPIAPQTSASTLISSVAPLQQKVVFPR